ncbi:unnamed protein product [Peronospora belbahrii]|uniref:Uncharacterized protein n=1 Tax=Peronospora belbahrii TaxID=622444 RepID=A0AAU9LAD1_9STRA|nr:unnamed protein product [Peronospora belbahrii]CAH0517061.1 unnamed protein product [Peronospora belbahrii]
MKVRRRSLLQLRKVAVIFFAMNAFASANTAPSLYDYKYDGTTTYCYWMDQGMQVTNLDFAYVLQQGTGSECPLTVSLEQTTTGTIVEGSEVEYAFTATLNLNDNAFDITELQMAVADPTTGVPMQVGHANIHTCARSTVCDVFRAGGNRKIADQETANFTSEGTASFRQKITYNSAGERNVFAHIILPPKDYLKKSYHFVSFITTNVEASTSSAEDDSGLPTSVTVGMIIGGVALVIVVILSVVFWRGKRRPGPETDHFRNSGFGLPASYAANKSKSHLDWNAEPEVRLTSHGSGFKDNYSAGNRSNGCRGPGLNASALAFNDRNSRQNKTVSSSGSLYSSRGPGDSGLIYNNYDTPMQRSGNKFGASGCSARDPFGNSQSMYPEDSMYEGESRIVEEDPNLEYGRTPDLETFGIGPDGRGPSMDSETSMGSSFEYKTDGSHFSQPAINPLLSGYGRESDLSSMGETEEYDMYEQRPPRMRGDTMDALLISGPDDNGRDVGENRSSSVSSIGTVDFTQDEPSVRNQKPIIFEPLDETLTMSAIAKAKVAKPDHANSNGLANTNASDNIEFVVHDNSIANFANSNVSSDFASTISSVDIDAKMKFDDTMNSASEYAGDIVSAADLVGPADFESSTVTDIVASSEFSASKTGDFTKPSSQSDYDEKSSFCSDLEGSSYSSGLSGSSYGTDGTGSSYGTNVADSAINATKTENDFNNTQSTYDFHDQSFCASDSYVSIASDDDPPPSEGIRPRRVSSADGESYEF